MNEDFLFVWCRISSVVCTVARLNLLGSFEKDATLATNCARQASSLTSTHSLFHIPLQQWTPTGDAFIIRSDLKRLESETLPQYFRHNRFQSLVRQLNFYSFRKINRERNVWIYKHKLFHRDRPEDLYLVRRRTCPGLDGRKQRFSRFSARKLTDGASASEAEDESSIEGAQVNEVSISSEGSTKRDLDTSAREQPEPKRVRSVEPAQPEVFVDTSMLAEDSGTPDDVEEVSSQTEKDERLEAVEQSLVVSEVSKKLEQYARRAAYGGSGPRSKRGGSGVVTPPYGSSQSFSSSALLTYDDEYMGQETSDPVDSLDFVTDSESLSSSEWPRSVTPDKLKAVVAIENVATARTLVSRILESRPESDRADLLAPSSVIRFCVATAPVHEDLCAKILQLLASCDQLARDFHTYRSALRPGSMAGRETLQQIWARESSRLEAIRDFKTFAVNVFTKFLAPSEFALASGDRSILERTAEAWVESL